MKLGAHVSTAGGLDKAIDRGVEIGCETIQIFGSPPQGWAFKTVSEDMTKLFRGKAREADISPVFFHAIYLINLGNPNPSNVEKGIESLINYMKLSAEIGASGVIFHPGSHKGAGFEGILAQTVASIQQVLENSPEGPWLTLENMAGMGQHIGANFQELATIIKEVDSPRVKVCLDTQHCFAAGYDVSATEGVEKMIAQFDETVGLDRLVAIHANDSKPTLGAGLDRHENIGQGHIGIQGFEAILSHSAFSGLPFFLEVPGFEGGGPDKQNLDILKEVRARVGADH